MSALRRPHEVSRRILRLSGSSLGPTNNVVPSKNSTVVAPISTFRESQGLDAVFVDEAQFLTREQVWQLAQVGDELGIPVLCYGLRTDFQGKLFEGAAELLAIADDLREARTICHCGRKATMNLRFDASGDAVTEGVQVGVTKANYLSLCRKHWLERMQGGPSADPVNADSAARSEQAELAE